MTIQAPPAPQPLFQRNMLDPTNPWQMAAFCGAWLYCTDDDAIKAAWDNVGRRAAHLVTTYLEVGLASMGMKRGNREQRMAAYVRKYHWPTARDQNGQLLHPVMQSVPIVDPASGLPTGQTQQVPTEQGVDLWSRQLQTFPRQFVVDARDAFEINAPLPDWVKLEAGLLKAVEAQPGGKRALRSAVAAPKYESPRALRAA